MKLNRLKNEQGQLWLNVASSRYPLKGFVNLDNHIMMLILDFPFLVPIVPRRNRELLASYREARRNGAFVRHDCRKKLPVSDNSVDHILCSHYLEHVFPDEAMSILRDFMRALKPGATIHVIVPDLEALARKYLAGLDSQSVVAADDFVRTSLLSTPTRGTWRLRILELVGSFGLVHRWMYDVYSIRSRIKTLGFEILESNNTPSHYFRQNDGSVHVVARKPE